MEQREVFHLVFLRLFASRIKPNSYVLKGGVNLRFFFGSVRYSEDMDLDVKGIDVYLLKEIVMETLSSKVLLLGLRPFQIDDVVLPDMKVAKQTETTQRFKVHLLTATGEDLFTKIEFSRRKFEESVSTESISEKVLKHYKLPPLLISHYKADAAMLQKIRALADRSLTQARDIFDLFVLLSQVEEVEHLSKAIPRKTLERAYKNVFDLEFAAFRDTVLSYLGKDDQKMYGRKEVWEDVQLKVAHLIEGLMKDG